MATVRLIIIICERKIALDAVLDTFVFTRPLLSFQCAFTIQKASGKPDYRHFSRYYI
jgi:hypothetical protein